MAEFKDLDFEQQQELIAKNDRDMSLLFREVFTTDSGRKVLEQLLIDLKYFDNCTTSDEIALNNYAKFMIKNRLRINNRERITGAILDSQESI